MLAIRCAILARQSGQGIGKEKKFNDEQESQEYNSVFGRRNVRINRDSSEDSSSGEK